MAAYLLSLQLPPESHIAIYGKNSAHWIMTDLAVWMAGHVTVPLYPTLNAETAAQPTFPDPDRLASIIYTSGSTGQPKGVMHSFRTFMMVAQNIQGQFELSSNERMLSYLPLAHGLERAVLEGTSLYVGCHMFFAGNLDTFIEDLNRASPTVFVSVPRLWTKFQHGINDKIPPRIQKAIFHVPVINKMFRKFILKKLGLELLEGYGMSENLAYSHVNRKGANRLGYVGFPQLGVECRIADEGEVQVNQTLEPHEKLGFIVVISEPWTMENDLLTPTMKIRRQKIEDQYVDKFEPWAKQKCSVVWA